MYPVLLFFVSNSLHHSLVMISSSLSMQELQSKFRYNDLAKSILNISLLKKSWSSIYKDYFPNLFFFFLHTSLSCFSYHIFAMVKNIIHIIIEPQHEISNNVVGATSKASDQPAHTHSLIRAFASRLHVS